MEAIQKIYCRSFQNVLKYTKPLLPYRKPHVYGSIHNIPMILHKEKIKRVMLISGSNTKKNGLVKMVSDICNKEGIKVTIWSKVTPNPTTTLVNEGKKVFKSNLCQGLIALGGGSAIDTAKAIGALMANPGKKLSKMKGNIKVFWPIPLLIAIPTTAGSGSETTLSAVITDSKNHHKFTINDFNLIPKYAILDPIMTIGMPKSITASSGMDAMTHAIEAFIGNSTNVGTRHASSKAIKLIFKNLEKTYNNPEDLFARKEMLHAAFLAGNAFSRSYVGYIHAVAHSLGGRYNVPHGLACAILLPKVLEKYGPCIHPKLAKLARILGFTEDVDDDFASKIFIAEIRKLNRRLGIADTISGIKFEDIPGMAIEAAKEANPLYPVPRLMDANELEKIYYDLIY